jgi:hypothetical protein
MTGIADEALLRASHIVAWADCESDDLRLDVHNGLLLSALWDAAFDCGLVSFGDGGEVLISKKLGLAAINCLGLGASIPTMQLTDEHRKNLARHRLRHGF